MKKVSIIIPFYSHLDWLYEAIESVFAQTYTNFEVILVNDGSKEDMSKFLHKYGERIIYLEQENAGPASARNNGIRHATGDYIAFEDSDDVWLPTKLEKQVAFMEKTNTMWSHTGFYYWWPKSGKLKEVNTSRDYDDIREQRRISTQLATPSMLIDARVFREQQLFFPEDKRNGEDDQLYTELSKRYKICLVEEPLLKVRMRDGNSNSHAIERFNLRVENYRKWKANGEELPFMVHFIYKHYELYSKLFGRHSNAFKDKLAKSLWILPYLWERLYVRYLFKVNIKDEKYILRVFPGKNS